MNGQHFEVGEVAYHVEWQCDVTITSALYYGRGLCVATGKRSHAYRHDVERSDGKADPFGGHAWSARPENLRKKRPPRDDLKVVRWSDLPWQPAKEHA